MRSENISERLEYSSKLDIWDGDLGMQERADLKIYFWPLQNIFPGRWSLLDKAPQNCAGPSN